MLTNPFPHNQNMNLRIHVHSGGDQDPLEGSGRGCINMVRAAKVVTRVKDYGLSQPSPGKEPDPPGSPLHIEIPVDKPETTPRILMESLSVRGIIQMPKPPKTIQLSRIWDRLLVQCVH